jgi:type II secretory pathway pseudopilin PulG
MKPVKINGFTIVETMLFLGITGLLIMGVLVGTGTSINIQRYHDSVTSLQSFLQQQYSNVANVSNDVMGNSCGTDTTTTWGQSDCVILGKYITIDGNTNNNLVSVQDVLGTQCSTSTGVNDLTALENCIIKTSTSNAETYDIAWDASAVKAKGGPLELSMLILRSPSSGIIRTLISSKSTTVIDDSGINEILTDPSALSNEAKICVNSNGLFTGTTMAVLVDNNASSSIGVEILGDKSGC